MSGFRIRAVNADDHGEVALIAERMQLTLGEVVGEEGPSMYSMDWLIDRVRWHLDATQCTGAVYVAESAGTVVGHTIVRAEEDENDDSMGLFSTTYVAKSARRQGIADAFIATGERWMIQHGLRFAATHTSKTNTPLIRLYEKHQYAIVLRIPENKMIRLGKHL
tara:strand:+ start:21278 stop:21769 length:492 start_codon:yes stop_codon:yes gene_type:complete